jgi:hypothetical protein
MHNKCRQIVGTDDHDRWWHEIRHSRIPYKCHNLIPYDFYGHARQHPVHNRYPTTEALIARLDLAQETRRALGQQVQRNRQSALPERAIGYKY